MAGLREFVVQCNTEEKCIEHLAGLRWPGGYERLPRARGLHSMRPWKPAEHGAVGDRRCRALADFSLVMNFFDGTTSLCDLLAPLAEKPQDLAAEIARINGRTI